MIEVFATARVVGFHYWPDAPPEHAYLKHQHRHEFVITAHNEVSHPDRQIEINQLKHDIEARLHGLFGNPCQFHAMSCEDIALLLAEHFGLSRVRVAEDGFNGAEVTQ